MTVSHPSKTSSILEYRVLNNIKTGQCNRTSKRNIPDLINISLLPDLVKDLKHGGHHVDREVKSFLVNCHPYVSAIA